MREVIAEITNAHIENFNEKMEMVARLEQTKRYAKEHPEIIAKVFFDYHYILKNALSLPESDLEIIKEANKTLGNNRLDLFLNIVGKDKNRFKKTINKITTNPIADIYQAGINQLSEMMKLANEYRNELEARGEKPVPKDGTEPWDSMIWGYTNGTNDPIIDVHFVIAHAINRVFAQEYKEEIKKLELSKVEQKDWLVNMMTEIILLKSLKGEARANSMYQIWKPKRPDGLGWISGNREVVYKKILNNS